MGLLNRLRGSDGAGRTRRASRVDNALALARVLISHPADAGQIKLAEALADAYREMNDAEAKAFFAGLTVQFAPDPTALAAAAHAYLNAPTVKGAYALSAAAEPPRQEVFRRLNTAKDGTFLIVQMRYRLARMAGRDGAIEPLEADLRHLLSSWFNRGFLEVREINWRTPAAVLEKLIQYEAVHAIRDWSDLRGRLEHDRRCFAFFHPAMPDEPLIFIEVGLTSEMSSAIAPLLEARAQRGISPMPRAAIFYSISNCQPGLKNIPFGDFLIKQVVKDLQAQFPSLRVFATLSPIPGFRVWLERACEIGKIVPPSVARALLSPGWIDDPRRAEALRTPLLSLCARYLSGVGADGAAGTDFDPVARFHLSNGARLERINWRANLSPLGLQQSWGLMVNYRYRLGDIDANQEAFAFDGRVHKSHAVASLLNTPVRFQDGAMAQVA